ncbi:hypothetical protein LCGC14_2118180, partial [marine sediment metagenome]
MFLSGMYSFVSSTGEGKYPDGMDVEVFSFETLGKVWEEAEDLDDKEHVTSYILKNPDRWTSYRIKPKLPEIKLSVDTQEDLELVRMISKQLGDRFKLQDVYDMLSIKVCPTVLSVPTINVEYMEIIEP